MRRAIPGRPCCFGWSYRPLKPRVKVARGRAKLKNNFSALSPVNSLTTTTGADEGRADELSVARLLGIRRAGFRGFGMKSLGWVVAAGRRMCRAGAMRRRVVKISPVPVTKYRLTRRTTSLVGWRMPGRFASSKSGRPSDKPKRARARGMTPRAPKPVDLGKMRGNDWLPGDWLCRECDTHNWGWRKTCELCGAAVTPEVIEESKMESVPTWDCVACRFTNDATRGVCYACRAPRDDPLQSLASHDSWYCHRCLVYNDESESNCYNCMRTQAECAGDPKGIKKPSGNRYLRPGDWVCSRCTTLNNAKNMRCDNCRKSRTKEEIFQRKPQPGDWICGSCSELNFAKNENCFICKRPIDEDAVVISDNVNQAGSWECPRCQLHNGRYAKSCASCGFEASKSLRAELRREFAEQAPPLSGGVSDNIPPSLAKKGFQQRRRARLFPPTDLLFGDAEASDKIVESFAALSAFSPRRERRVVGPLIDATLAGEDTTETPVEVEVEWFCYNCGERNTGLAPCVACSPQEQEQGDASLSKNAETSENGKTSNKAETQ